MGFAKNALFISLMAVLLVLAGCSSKDAVNENMKNAANDMTDKMLIGINEDNYEKFSEDFDKKMKYSMPESQFKIKNAEIKRKIGKYISKEYIGSEKKDRYNIVEFKGKFSGEKNDVIIKTVLSESNGKYLVSDLLLDSPNLQKE